MNGKEKILDQLKNNHQQCQNLVLARGWHLRQRSGEIELKVVGNEKEGGVGKVANDWNWSRTAAIDILLAFKFAVVFILMYFRFGQVNQN